MLIAIIALIACVALPFGTLLITVSQDKRDGVNGW